MCLNRREKIAEKKWEKRLNRRTPILAHCPALDSKLTPLQKRAAFNNDNFSHARKWNRKRTHILPISPTDSDERDIKPIQESSKHVGVTKRSSLDSPPVSPPLTRSHLRASKVCNDPKRLGINFHF